MDQVTSLLEYNLPPAGLRQKNLLVSSYQIPQVRLLKVLLEKLIW